MNQGINRTLKVASYNICHGHYAAFDWQRLAESVSGADLVGIQEVDQFTQRSHRQDTVMALKSALGLPFAFFIPAMNFDGGQYGTAIFSRYPFQNAALYSLDAEGHEPRAYGQVTVLLPSGIELVFINTHLSYESNALRSKQMTALANHIAAMPADKPLIVTGDFNTEAFEAFAPLTSGGLALVNHTRHRLPTFRTSRIAIDNILYDPTWLTPRSIAMQESDASDHDALIATFACLSN